MNKIRYFLSIAVCGIFFMLTLPAQAVVTYIHTDILGSPVAESDSNGTLIKKLHYKPFGETLEPKQNTVGYTGHMEDKELGLTYMQARYYDPLIGRFYSNDPIGFRDVHSFNRYTYANNNPYKYVDPDGKWAIPLIIGLEELGKAALVTAGVIGTGAGIEQTIIAVSESANESKNPVKGILEGATKGEKTKGKTDNFDKPGGMDQANSDFDQAVDPDSVKTITDSKGGEGRKGVVNDGSGRKINVRPNSSDGRPTVEVQNGKNKTKIRYDE
jgi:RHS repeat-associated protein